MAKKLTLIIATLFFLTSCGSTTTKNTPVNSTPTATQSAAKFSVPTDCRKTQILAAFPASIPNPVWIDTKWQPAAGTDLAATYKAGGIACSYGIQSAEVGGTFTWAPDSNGLFASRIAGWKNAGYVKTDIAGLAENDAWVISDMARNKMEIPSWSVNILINGTWISIGGRFIQRTTDALPLIKAAVESLGTL